VEKLCMYGIVSLVFIATILYGVSVKDYMQRNSVYADQDGIVDLSNKNITDLDGLEEIFQNNVVNVLWLSYNQIKEVPENIFAYADQLKQLDLSYNQLESLSGNCFAHLGQLRMLYLAHNRIHTMAEDAFMHLNRLTILCLEHNRLEMIPVGLFDYLTNLQGLILAHNNLQILPKKIFDYLYVLRYLDLTQNLFKETDDEIKAYYLIHTPVYLELKLKDAQQKHAEVIQQKFLTHLANIASRQNTHQKKRNRR
jgi:Leucine-rich repeat (LRR) protein